MAAALLPQLLTHSLLLPIQIERCPSFSGAFTLNASTDKPGEIDITLASIFRGFLGHLPRYLWETVQSQSTSAGGTSAGDPSSLASRIVGYLRQVALDDALCVYSQTDLDLVRKSLAPFHKSTKKGGSCVADRIDLTGLVAALE